MHVIIDVSSFFGEKRADTNNPQKRTDINNPPTPIILPNNPPCRAVGLVEQARQAQAARPHWPPPGTPGPRTGPTGWPALAAARPCPGRLGSGPNPAATALADRLLGDEHHYVRMAAAEALAALGGHPSGVEGFSMWVRFGGSGSG